MANALRKKRTRNNRSRMLYRPCTYAGKNTAQIKRVADSRGKHKENRGVYKKIK